MYDAPNSKSFCRPRRSSLAIAPVSFTAIWYQKPLFPG